MTTQYSIQPLEHSEDLKPEGDCYAPQIVLTHEGYGHWNITELNTESLPFTAEEFNEWRSELAARQLDLDHLCRFIKIFYGIEVIYSGTHGFSQGDWGYSFVFGTPEFFEVTGAPRIQESDHTDLCAWVWGDVYEVYTKAVTHTETCNLGHDHVIVDEPSEPYYIIYGMDEAMKFAKKYNIEIEWP